MTKQQFLKLCSDPKKVKDWKAWVKAWEQVKKRYAK